MNDYRAFGGELRKGKLHLINGEDAKTFCGKRLIDCPGRLIIGTCSEVDCKSCVAAFQAQLNRQLERSEAEQREYQRQAERQAENARWRIAYDEYLNSPQWRKKRALILDRCGGMCQGCGLHPATQVHHLQYPQNVLPGSDEWMRQEKLFHLVGICTRCHEDIHQRTNEDETA